MIDLWGAGSRPIPSSRSRTRSPRTIRRVPPLHGSLWWSLAGYRRRFPRHRCGSRGGGSRRPGAAMRC
jgi:hypothetical protein